MGDVRGSSLDEILKVFSQRAAEAEERLASLEAVVSNKHVTEAKDIHLVNDLRPELEIARKELAAEREKASKEIEKLTAENAKLQYRIRHLVRALKEADSKSGP